jgi:hypothetical protein
MWRSQTSHGSQPSRDFKVNAGAEVLDPTLLLESTVLSQRARSSHEFFNVPPDILSSK